MLLGFASETMENFDVNNFQSFATMATNALWTNVSLVNVVTFSTRHCPIAIAHRWIARATDVIPRFVKKQILVPSASPPEKDVSATILTIVQLMNASLTSICLLKRIVHSRSIHLFLAALR